MAGSILIVEDSPAMRSFIIAALEDMEDGPRLLETGSGFEAIKMLPRERIDLIITDINMPGINGLELISFVKGNRSYAGIPLIIVTTESGQKDRERGLELGADEYLVKPFAPEALRDLVRKHLGH